MNEESVFGAGKPEGASEASAAAEASARLGELAGSVEIGPVPYDRLVAGGRRRLLRRRLVTAGAAAALVAAVGGGVVFATGRGSGADVTVAAAPTTVAAPVTPGSVPSATPTPARDPYTPIRVKLGEGTRDGHTWQAWAALWPAAPTKEAAHRQAQLIFEDRHAAIPQLPPLTEAQIDRSWRPDMDQVNHYLTVDGKRQVDDSTHPVPAPGTPGARDGSSSPTDVGGSMLGFKGGEMGDSPVVVAGVKPKVARIVVTWRTGGATEAVPVAVADSGTRWFAIAKKPGSDAETFTYYGADGAVLGTDTGWFRSS
ncbi:hypothetical protein [Streptomyces sp. NRRL WC-3742]|uniref:hypothetical protein n=1 Tax=Streptomyces sp. NRRL WC-3742 TaxID=1463934 RepID=UPI0004C8B6C2|nr:hypothetical protein [Streptomyces sp. NRRL WC-3742]